MLIFVCSSIVRGLYCSKNITPSILEHYDNRTFCQFVQTDQPNQEEIIAMRIDNPTNEQITNLYRQGLLYNLRQLPANEHRIYVHPRLVLRYKHARDAKDFPFFLHSAQYATFTGHNLTATQALDLALNEHPSLAYYTFGKLRYRFNDLLASALKTNQVFIV